MLNANIYLVGRPHKRASSFFEILASYFELDDAISHIKDYNLNKPAYSWLEMKIINTQYKYKE